MFVGVVFPRARHDSRDLSLKDENMFSKEASGDHVFSTSREVIKKGKKAFFWDLNIYTEIMGFY